MLEHVPDDDHVGDSGGHVIANRRDRRPSLGSPRGLRIIADRVPVLRVQDERHARTKPATEVDIGGLSRPWGVREQLIGHDLRRGFDTQRCRARRGLRRVEVAFQPSSDVCRELPVPGLQLASRSPDSKPGSLISIGLQTPIRSLRRELDVVVPGAARPILEDPKYDPRGVRIHRADDLDGLPGRTDHRAVIHVVEKSGGIAAFHAEP